MAFFAESGPLEQVLGGPNGPVTRVRTTEAERLARASCDNGRRPVEADGPGTLLVPGTAPAVVGAVAAENGVALSELVAVSRSLEDAFLELTGEAA